MRKALVLFSGGLDSMLAVRLMQDQSKVEVAGIHFVNVFNSSEGAESERLPARQAAAGLGLPLRVEDNSEALLGFVKEARYGLGKNMNPCIDCRIYILRRAAAVMAETGADFLVTGEVVGERPMSQNRQSLRLIEKESGAADVLVRPLSARLLGPTLPEREGWVDRERFLDISGRSRKRQMALAEQYGIGDYPSPAGGCLLTDPGFSARMRDLIKNGAGCAVCDCRLLKVGRHFRLEGGVKAVVGRNQEENEVIAGLARAGDRLAEVATHPGPLTLVRGGDEGRDLGVESGAVRLAAGITARYSKAACLARVAVRVRRPGESRDEGEVIEVAPVSSERMAPLWVVRGEKGKRRSGVGE